MMDPTPFEQVARRLKPQNRLLRAWPLLGGVSAEVTAIEVAQADGHIVKCIVRRHGPADLGHNPNIARDEFTLLKLLRAEGVAAPDAYLVDTSGEIFPTPYLVIEFIEGQTPQHPTYPAHFASQLAAHLVKIHGVALTRIDLSFLPQKSAKVARKLATIPPQFDVALDEERLRAALGALGSPESCNGAVLLHGDFWPGNTLWNDEGRLAAVIDWENAELGDPLADVANARLEILWSAGRAAMEAFTTHYRALNPIDMTHLPYWELFAALRFAGNLSGFGLDEATMSRMVAEHRWFVAQALERC